VRNSVVDGQDRKKLLTGRTVLFGIIAFFAVVVGANLTLTVLAIGTMPGTEVDSSYRASLAFNSEIWAARAQAARHWHVAARFERGTGGRATVRIDARDGQGAPLTGYAFAARLMRPSDQSADRTITLAERESGIYRGAANSVAPGLWELVIEASRGSERLFLSRHRLALK